MAKNIDEEECIETITIMGDKGERLEFVELATITYEDNSYIVLDPLEPIEGLDEGDVLIYRVDEKGGFHNVDDARIVDAVFEEFLEYVEEMEEDSSL